MSAKKMSSEEAKKRNSEKDRNIFYRYFFITIFLGVMAIAILVSAFNIGVSEKKEWLKVAEGMKRPDRTDRKSTCLNSSH